jgi:DMSO/TMAO reductase YedYZ heme-binding membrane subunit
MTHGFPARLILIAGDMLIFVFFAVQGRATHDISLGDLPVATILAVSAPFAVPWFVIAALIGVFRTSTLAHPKRMLSRTGLAWLLAGCIGLLARAALLQRAIVLPFVVTALGIIGALLITWHALLSTVYSRWSGQQAHDG